VIVIGAPRLNPDPDTISTPPTSIVVVRPPVAVVGEGSAVAVA
jgi:hypothetical protein